jgi:hypothetical protein
VTSPLKDRDALLAKVTEYLAVKPWLTPDQAVAGVCDAIRYSWVIPADEYAAGVHELIQKLRDQGFGLERLATFWGGPDFKGITSVWRSADGKLFEQQFHVPESRHARDFTFRMYDRMRQPGAGPGYRTEIRALIREVMAAVPVPPGAAAIAPFPPGPGPMRPEPGPQPTATSPTPNVRWYAATDLLAGPADRPLCAILRRTVDEYGEHDEAFGRYGPGPLRWGRTSVLYSAERGDLAHWFSEVSEDDAAVIREQVRRTAEIRPA